MSAVASRPPGRIITFYSYKGGTGRSMLLANAAMVLASNDRKVAVIDWDLEAPGLHRYFRPFLADPELNATLGLIDMLSGYWDALVELDGAADPPPDGWAQRYLDIYRYAVTLSLPCTEGGGSLVFMPAGRQNTGYGNRVSAFDWDAFYADAGGRGFVEALAQRLRAEFDYVLIDSRTGVSDTAGICTIHLPDDLVVCFTYNNQNMLGASGVAQYAAAARQDMVRASEQQRLSNDTATTTTTATATATAPGLAGPTPACSPLRLYPVPTRADYQLPDLLNPRRERAQRLFAWTLDDMPADQAREYWSDVEQPYLPIHSYHETLACLTDQPFDRSSMLTATQNVVRRITNGAVQRWLPMFTDEVRQRLRGEMESAGAPVAAPQAHAEALPGASDAALADAARSGSVAPATAPTAAPANLADRPSPATSVAPPPAETTRAAPRWTERDLDNAWPVLLRLLKPGVADGAVDYRTVPAAQLSHLSRTVDELIQRGLLLVRAGDGGASLVELSSYARSAPEPLRQRLWADTALSDRLLEVEDLTTRWRQSSSRDESLLKDSRWLAAAQPQLDALGSLRALTPGEDLYLVSCARRVEAQSARHTLRITRSMVAATLVGLVAALAWSTLQRRESDVALAQARSHVEQTRMDIERAELASRMAQRELALRLEALTAATRQAAGAPLLAKPAPVAPKPSSSASGVDPALADLSFELFACAGLDAGAVPYARRVLSALRRLGVPDGKAWITEIDRAKWESTFQPLSMPYQIRHSVSQAREARAAARLLADTGFTAGLPWRTVPVQQDSLGYLSLVLCKPK